VDDDQPVAIAELMLAEDRRSAAWLWGALALATGKGKQVLGLLEETKAEDLLDLAHWLALARTPEQERVKQRWTLMMREPPGAVLPAAMFVVATIVPSEASVEVWLDRVFQDVHREQPIRAMLARAECARWRGDAASERLWRDRAARLTKLIDGYPRALLAHLVELR
jgi:hypothetical protein